MIDSNQLTTQATSIQRVKYFPVELFCTNMMPNSPYDIYVDDVLVNDFCKPYGGNLGDDLISDANGKLRIQWMFSINYNQNYLSNQNNSTGVVNSTKTIRFVDPHGRESLTYMPILMKAS